MARITYREPCSDDEDWSNVTDTNERRRIQNRNNQRAFRRRKVRLRQNEQMNVKFVRTSRAILLPKPLPSCTEHTLPLLLPPPPPENTPDPEGPQYDAIPAMDFHHEFPPAPPLFSMHSMIDQQLDFESYRMFHYASTSLWSLCETILETNEHVAVAMTRLALSCPLTMDVFIWTAAMELEFYSHNPSNKKILLKHQTRALRSIRQGIEKNDISDELVQAVYSLVTADQPPAIFKSTEEIMSGPDPSPYGDYDPPLASLGSLDALCQMQFSDNHAEVAVKLMASRGGLSTMNIPEFAYQIQHVDIIRNSGHGCKPSFELCKPYRHVLETRMPLYRSSAFHSYPVDPTFNTLLLDLRTFLRQVDIYMNSMQPIVTSTVLITWRNINQHRLLSLPDDQDQLFRLTTLIFSYNVTFPVPYRHLIDKWTKELMPYIHEAPETSEDALWAIIITAITLPNEAIMNDLRTKARKIVKTLNIRTWNDLKTVLNKYLWLNHSCDAGGVRFWKSISTSAESDAHYGVIETFRSLIECKRVYCL